MVCYSEGDSACPVRARADDTLLWGLVSVSVSGSGKGNGTTGTPRAASSSSGGYVTAARGRLGYVQVGRVLQSVRYADVYMAPVR